MLFMASNSTNTPWLVLGGLAIVGGVCIYLHIKKNKNKEKPAYENENANEKVVSSIQYDETIVGQMKSMMRFFSGTLNTLEDVVKEGDTNDSRVLFENLSQIISAHGGELLNKWFSDFANDRNTWDSALCKKKARMLYDMLRQCGVQKSTEIRLKWDAMAEEHYRKIDKIEYGDICEVLAPCWIYEKKVFEKGLVKKAN